ncbi:hypothetical protein [Streptomyces liangshanensis]|uniref:hypothetical protein n=1 Tax=Streptomyces liangshanensis TaxID=2717324 RepID=UPI0036DBAB5D
MADSSTPQPQPGSSPSGTAGSGGASTPGDPPDAGRRRPPYRGDRVVWCLRAALFTYGVALAVVGIADVFWGNDFDVRTHGVVLVGTAAVVAGGTLVALRPEGRLGSVRGWAPRVADAVALLSTVWVLLCVGSNFARQVVLILTAGVALFAGLVALALLVADFTPAAGPRPGETPPAATPATMSSAEATLRGALLTAGAGLLAACVTLPQFWYSVRYEPSTSPPVVMVENGITEVEVRKDRLELTAEITLENTGRTPVRMLTSLYEISGTRIRLASKPLPHDNLPFDRVFGGNYGSAARLSTYTTYTSPQQIQVGPVGEDYAWIGPGEKLRTTLQAHAPLGEFDLLRLTTDIAVARADRVETAAGGAGNYPDGRRRMYCDGTLIAESRRPLAHVGWFDRLTESDRELVTFWALSGDSGDNSPWWPAFPWTNVSIQHTGRGCEHALVPDRDGLEDDAMVGWASSVAEAAVPEEEPAAPAKPAKKR